MRQRSVKQGFRDGPANPAVIFSTSKLRYDGRKGGSDNGLRMGMMSDMTCQAEHRCGWTYLIQGGEEDTRHEAAKDKAHPVLRKDMLLILFPVCSGLHLFGWGLGLRGRKRGARNGGWFIWLGGHGWTETGESAARTSLQTQRRGERASKSADDVGRRRRGRARRRVDSGRPWGRKRGYFNEGLQMP